MDNIYDNDSFYSADLDLSSIEAKWTSENAKTLDLQRIHNSHPAESLKEEDELFKGLDSIKNSEDREKQQKNSLVAQLDEDRPTLKDSCKPPSNKNSQKKSTRQIDFDTLSASIQEIGDDLSSFQEELLKAGRSPSRSTYHSVSPEKISPEKAALLDRSHPIAIGKN